MAQNYTTKGCTRKVTQVTNSKKAACRGIIVDNWYHHASLICFLHLLFSEIDVHVLPTYNLTSLTSNEASTVPVITPTTLPAFPLFTVWAKDSAHLLPVCESAAPPPPSPSPTQNTQCLTFIILHLPLTLFILRCICLQICLCVRLYLQKSMRSWAVSLWIFFSCCCVKGCRDGKNDRHFQLVSSHCSDMCVHVHYLQHSSKLSAPLHSDRFTTVIHTFYILERKE